MNLVKTIGLNTKYYRFKRGLSETDFAKELQIEKDKLRKIESGHEKLEIEDIEKIVKTLAIKPSDLYNFELAAQMECYGLKYFN